MTRNGLIGELRVAARPRPAKLAAWIAFAVLLALTLVGAVVFRQLQADAEQAAAWSLHHPPCPLADNQALHGGRPPMAASYGGARFDRRSGFIQCVRRRYDLGHGRKDYAVCQFSSPQAVRVTIGGTETVFTQPVGRSLRVAIADRGPICVLIDRLPLR
ncbi:hypothetical protein [Caulobacter sp. DWR1-3-2b1]|uniref:hypothetical protein n=1 Tax=Caulobacter sp. DWR1-3-2b1 TaxID=2804670 RepID=UPI003CEC405D